MQVLVRMTAARVVNAGTLAGPVRARQITRLTAHIRLVIAATLVALLLPAAASAQTSPIGTVTFVGQLTTLAGGASNGYSGDGGPATQAQLGGYLSGTRRDGGGNTYICDAGNARIRKVDSHGNISTIAGTGTLGYSGDGGLATQATLNGPDGIVVDSHGNIFISEFNNSAIREITLDGKISTFARLGFQLTDIAIDALDNLYITDYANQHVWKITPQGVRTLFAGNGSPGYSGDGGPATQAKLFNPNNLSIDAAGNVYIADANNDVIRKVDTGGTITTFAGSGGLGYDGDGGPATAARLFTPSHPGFDGFGNVYIPDNGNNVIRVVDKNGIINTFAGNGNAAYAGDGGAALNGSLNHPGFLNVDSTGMIYFTDSTDIRALVPATTLLLDTTQPSVTIQIQNTGNADLHFSSLTPSSPYLVSGGTCSTSTALPSGGICSVQLTPQSSGPLVAGTFTVASDASNPSAVLTLSTGAPISTSTALQVTPATINYGDSATLNATVSAGSMPTGSVTFTDASGAINAGPVTIDSNGLASTTVKPDAGTYNITASFTGTGNFQNSQSAAQPLTVNTAPVQVSLTGPGTSAPSGQSVTFNVQVTPTNPAAGTPSGLVQLLDGSTPLGRTSLDANGAASFTTSALGAGPHSLTVDYSGSQNFQFSISNTLNFTIIQTQTTSTSLSFSKSSINLGDSVTLTATVNGTTSTPTGTVTFSDSTNTITGGPTPVAGNGIAAVAVKPAAAGSYSITASFHGDTGFSDSASAAQVLHVIVPPVAVLSVASKAGATVPLLFDGSQSTATGGTIASYQWNFGDGSTSTTTDSTTTHTYASIGFYTATLVVTDTNGGKSTAVGSTITVLVAPVAVISMSVFGDDRQLHGPTTIGDLNYFASFSGFQSTSSGNIISYHWQICDIAAEVGANPQVFLRRPGPCVVTLTVTDDLGLTSAPATLTINVVQPPVAVLSGPSALTPVGQTVSFDGSASTGNAIAQYLFQAGDGTPGVYTTTPTVQHTYNKAGTFTARLTVTDTQGIESTEATFNVVVGAPPVAVISMSVFGDDRQLHGPTTIGDLNYFASFSGFQSTSSGNIVSYHWQICDIAAEVGANPQVFLRRPGPCVVTLTVTDDLGLTSAPATLTINVVQPPVAAMTAPAGPFPIGQTVSFDGSASTGNAIAQYLFQAGDGTPGVYTTTPTVQHTYNKAGTFTARLTVTDTQGIESTEATQIITIAPPPSAVLSGPSQLQAGVAASFDASQSTGYGGLVSYIWNFGDGAGPVVTTTAKATHSYTKAGSFTVILVVTDSLGGQSAPATAAFTVHPVVSAISPGHANAGSGALLLTVTGTGFTTDSAITWNGTPLTTSFLSASQLTASVPTANLAQMGTASVAVALGTNTSSSFTFTIDLASSASPTGPVPGSDYTVSPGSTISIPVSFPANVTITSTNCVNYPPGITCAYDSNSHNLIVNAAGTVPTGTYSGTVVFTERILTPTTAGLLLLLGLPWTRRRLRRNVSRWLAAAIIAAACLGMISGCASGGDMNLSLGTASVDLTLTVR